MESLARNEAKKRIIEKGGEVRDEITRDIWYYVTNNPNAHSERLRKARNIGITFIDESEFLRMIK